LKDANGLRRTVDALASDLRHEKVDAVIGIEARRVYFAPALAYHLGTGFVPVRKPKKLPAERLRSLMILNTARILWRSIVMLSATVIV